MAKGYVPDETKTLELRIYKKDKPEPRESVLTDWNGAIDASVYDPFCCTPAWQLAYHEAFVPHSTMAIATCEGHAVAFTESFLPNGHPCLTPLEAEWFSGRPVMSPVSSFVFALFVRRIVEGYRNHLPAFIVCGLTKDQREDLAHVYRRYLIFEYLKTVEQRSASLEGGLEGWLSRRSANFRSKLGRADRRAHRKGVEFERHIPETPEEAEALFDRMVAVEARSWKGKENSGIIEEHSQLFYRSMIRRLTLAPQAGDARVIFARKDGQDIGFIFGGMSCGVYRGLQFSYAEEWSELSIGDLLQLRQLEWLCEEGAIRYDMGMSDDPRMAYKKHWAEEVRSQEVWFVRPRPGYRL